MPCMRLLVWLVVATLIAAPSFAAVEYTLLVEEGPGREHSARRAVLVDGDRWRVEMLDEPAEPRSWDVLIRTPDHYIGLDHGRRAWWSELEQRRPHTVFPSLSAWTHPVKLRQAPPSNTRISFREPTAGFTMLGRDAVLHELELSTTIRGTGHVAGVDASVRATIRLWTVEGLPEVPREVDLRNVETTVPELDAVIASELAKVEGFVVRREIEITRELDPRFPTHERSVLTIEEIDVDAAATDQDFGVPAGYAEAAPVVGVPGVS